MTRFRNTISTYSSSVHGDLRSETDACLIDAVSHYAVEEDESYFPLYILKIRLKKEKQGGLIAREELCKKAWK